MLKWAKEKAWPKLKKIPVIGWVVILVSLVVTFLVFVVGGRTRRGGGASAPAGSVPTKTPEQHAEDDKKIEEKHQADLDQIDKKYDKAKEEWDSWIEDAKRGGKS